MPYTGEEQRFVLGVAYRAGPDPRIQKGLDGRRDWVSAAELEKAAWNFLRKGPRHGLFHIDGTTGHAETVESGIYRGPDWHVGDTTVFAGDWVMGSILDEPTWQMAKGGRITGYSPQGVAKGRAAAPKTVSLLKGAAAMNGGDVEIDEEDTYDTELYDLDTPQVDLVRKASNGVEQFLMMKGAGEGLLDTDYVRSLARGVDGGRDDTVTMSGSPAAMAAMIHGAAVRKVAKAQQPTHEDSHLGDKTMTTTRPAAARTGVSVAKADSGEDLDPTVIMAAPDPDAEGNPFEPGSPAWESADAATARKWTSLAVRLKAALGAMSERELLEAVGADPDDAEAAWDLQDAQCIMQCVIDTLASFAVGEQAAADMGEENFATVAKAMARFDPGVLDVFEGLVPVAKAGRATPGDTTELLGSVTAIQKVLKAMPTPATSGHAVADPKETAVTTTEAAKTEPTTAAAPTAPAPGPVHVAKAKTDPRVAVYTANGDLVGTCDPEDIAPVTDAKPATPEKADAPAASAMVPAESAAVIPGTQTVQAPAPDEQNVAKAAASAPEHSDVLTQTLVLVAKQLEASSQQSSQLAAEVQVLKGQVEFLAAKPDDRKKLLLNGATGTAGIADRGAPEDTLLELRKAVADAPDESTRNEAKRELAFATIKGRFAPRR
jgi:Putative phage serine protease XkdF